MSFQDKEFLGLRAFCVLQGKERSFGVDRVLSLRWVEKGKSGVGFNPKLALEVFIFGGGLEGRRCKTNTPIDWRLQSRRILKNQGKRRVLGVESFKESRFPLLVTLWVIDSDDSPKLHPQSITLMIS